KCRLSVDSVYRSGTTVENEKLHGARIARTGEHDENVVCGPRFRCRGRPHKPSAQKFSVSVAMTKCVTGTAALVAIALPLAGAMAQALSPTLVFEGNTTTDARQAVHIVVQAWGITGQEYEIPLGGFYVAHLLSGAISTTIDGQTTERLPGDY